MSDCEYGRLVDPLTERCLADVGAPGFALAEVVDTDGVLSMWFLDRAQLGVRGTDHGNEHPEHEHLGPLSARWRYRITDGPYRCGRRTATGHPCRSIVAESGRACAHHREDAHR